MYVLDNTAEYKQSIIEKVRNLAEHFRWKPLETDDNRVDGEGGGRRVT